MVFTSSGHLWQEVKEVNTKWNKALGVVCLKMQASAMLASHTSVTSINGLQMDVQYFMITAFCDYFTFGVITFGVIVKTKRND